MRAVGSQNLRFSENIGATLRLVVAQKLGEEQKDVKNVLKENISAVRNTGNPLNSYADHD